MSSGRKPKPHPATAARRIGTLLLVLVLVLVLEDWCQPFAGYHLYYPNRHEHSSAFGVVVDALLYKH